jgi:hypothetical protein
MGQAIGKIPPINLFNNSPISSSCCETPATRSRSPTKSDDDGPQVLRREDGHTECHLPRPYKHQSEKIKHLPKKRLPAK